MFKSFLIKNFRCFRNFTIEPLERVNLIAGMNNVGKTALLEAILIHAGSINPEYLTLADNYRGIPLGVEQNFSERWGWLFFNRHFDDLIELTSQNFDNEHSYLKIRLAESKISTIETSGKGVAYPSESPSESIGFRELILEFRNAQGKTSKSRAFIASNGKITIEREELMLFLKGYIISSHSNRLNKYDLDNFSMLARINRIEKEIFPTMKILEPRLTRLAILLSGGESIIHADVGIGELVPLPLLGDGMGRLLSILLAIPNVPGGIILIDEIENGLHHSVMVKIWKAIAQAARQSDVQVFATTHSWECIRAAHEAFTASETYDFRLHRLDRIDDKILPVTYDQETLATALKSELEVR